MCLQWVGLAKAGSPSESCGFEQRVYKEIVFLSSISVVLTGTSRDILES
jgi:hypothetical protein